jgi:hypothetical protein
MKEQKRPRGVDSAEARLARKPSERSAQPQEAQGADAHSGRGAQSALERMKKLERQRARSRGGFERPAG